MVQKTVNTKVKTGLKSIIIVQDLDICCFSGYCPSNNITSKTQIQKTTTKDFSRPEKPKTKDLKSASLYNDIVELAKKEKTSKKSLNGSGNTLGNQKNLDHWQ